MKKITTGSGITERDYYSFDSTASDIDGMERLSKAIQQGNRFERTHKRASKILEEVGLPCYPAVAYSRDKPEDCRRAPVVEIKNPGEEDIWRSYYGGFRRWAIPSTSKDKLTFLRAYVIDDRAPASTRGAQQGTCGLPSIRIPRRTTEDDASLG